jgi:hypothetical protein
MAAACGAQVVLEDDGSGGAGGATTSTGGTTKSTTKSTTGGMTTGTNCEALLQALDQATVVATKCNPFISSNQCTQIVNDTCGCPTVALSATEPVAAQKREEAYATWVGAGCGPYDCFACDPAEGGACLPGPNGDTGACVGLQTF